MSYFSLVGSISLVIMWTIGIVFNGIDFAEVFTLPIGILVMFIILADALWGISREGSDI